MKRFGLSLTLPLGVLAFALACTDTISPDPHGGLTPKDPTRVLGTGNIPPPPVDAAIEVTITGVAEASLTGVSNAAVFVVSGAFNGVYFSNGGSLGAGLAAIELSDQSLGSLGTAWLRFDNKQPAEFGTTTSANARVQRSDDKFFGHGTLKFYNEFEVTIDEVTFFYANPACDAAGEPCATITFNAHVNGEAGFTGTAEAFDREFCSFIPVEGGRGFYSCEDEILQ